MGEQTFLCQWWVNVTTQICNWRSSSLLNCAVSIERHNLSLSAHIDFLLCGHNENKWIVIHICLFSPEQSAVHAWTRTCPVKSLRLSAYHENGQCCAFTFFFTDNDLITNPARDHTSCLWCVCLHLISIIASKIQFCPLEPWLKGKGDWNALLTQPDFIILEKES